ncbi:cell adhesion molecule CEACAM1-like [Lithobates pipiens]
MILYPPTTAQKSQPFPTTTASSFFLEHAGTPQGKVQEIFTRLGSDLLIPIKRHLTLNPTDTWECDEIYWYYEKSPGDWKKIAVHMNCDPSDLRYFPNTRISDNGSLIISNVTPENDGRYRVYIENYTGRLIQRDDYFIHVEVPLSDITVTSSCLPDGSAEAECSVKGSDPRYSWSLDGRSVSSHRRVTLPPPVSGTLHCDVTNQINNLSRSINISCPLPVSDPVLDVRCLQNGSAEISCWVENGTDPSIYLTVSGGLGIYDVTSSERTVRVTVPPVSPPDSWNIRCSAKNNISERSTNQTQDACPVPLSDITVTSSCLPDGSAEAECSVKGSDPRYSWSLDGRSVSSHRRVTLLPPVSGTLRCDVTNQINNLSRSINISCAEIRSCWGHFLSSGAVFVLYTGLLIFMVNDLRKMKNEKNEKSRSERRTRRRDPMEVEMEMEPTYYNEGT